MSAEETMRSSLIAWMARPAAGTGGSGSAAGPA